MTSAAVAGLKGRTVILDIDGTLVAVGDGVVSPVIAAAAERLKRENLVYLLTNRGDKSRAAKVAAELGLPLIFTPHRKPDRRTVTGLSLKDPVVIGDKWLTDGLFAKAIGADFIRVSRLTHPADPWFDKATFLLDDLVLGIFHHVALLRPRHYLKNLLVLAPMFFAVKLFDAGALDRSLAMFAVFCLTASAGYAINDVVDRENDRAHPEKSRRPVAAGRVSVSGALILAAVLLSVSAWIVFRFIPSTAPLAAAYFLSSSAYSLFLKRVPLIEMLAFAWFYYARVLGGAAAAGVPISAWLTLSIIFLALFLVVGKRYAELKAGRSRAALSHYPEKFLEGMLLVSVALVLVCYGLYTILGVSSPYAVYSTVFVLFGIMRYLQLAFRGGAIEYPEKIVVSDTGVLAASTGWALYMMFIYYL